MKSKVKLLFILSILFSIQSFAQKNLSLLSSITYPGTLAGVWHYAKNGKEYALSGSNVGIAIADITNPAAPQKLFTLPGVTNLWHEVKVEGDYAYAVSEGTDPNGILNGLQVINLNYLPDSAPNHFWKGDSTIAGQLANAHTVTTANGYVYINGHHIAALNQGVIIASLADPWNPHFVGSETDSYCHDSYVRGDTLWASDIYVGQFAVYNITNRGNPVLLATQATPYQFNHSTWLSDNGRYLFATDEKSGAPMSAYDVSDLNNIQLVDEYRTINMQPAEVHNPRVLNDFVVCSCYGSQVTLVDAAEPDNMIEVGNYPTGNSLCWDADPYLPSGNIVATDMNAHTLYIFKPTYIRACYLRGTVTDSVTNQPIINAHVNILSTTAHDSTDLSGNYKTGIADGGSYQIQFSKSGYITKTIATTLSNGVLTQLNVKLVPNNVGVDELNAEPLVKIKSNPSDNIVIEIAAAAWQNSDELTIVITDETGRLVFNKSLIRNSQLENGYYELLTKNCELTNGAYYFCLLNKSGKNISRGKLMVVAAHY